MMLPFITRLAKVEDLQFTETKIENSVSDIADLCNTKSIRNKVRLNVCDAVFAPRKNIKVDQRSKVYEY